MRNSNSEIYICKVCLCGERSKILAWNRSKLCAMVRDSYKERDDFLHRYLRPWERAICWGVKFY